MLTTTSSGWTAQFVAQTRRLAEYKETVSRLFPALGRQLVDERSIRDVDAIVLALFLRCYPGKLSVLEVGMVLGVSTFHLASQPSVSSVLCVYPTLQEETGASSEHPDTEVEPMVGPRIIDVARTALAEFADESAKIQLRTGDLSSAWTYQHSDSPDGSEEKQSAAPELTVDEPLLVFVNSARARETVDADLRAIFEASPHAVAIFDHCRGHRGPFVQAGIASFLESAQDGYHFRLFCDLGPGMATSHLGIVYPDADSAEVQQCLNELGNLFSERLDPLWLAAREQEMVGIVNTYKDEVENLNEQYQELMGEHQLLMGRNTELQRRVSQLEKRKAQLEERNAGLKEEKKEFQKRNSQLRKNNSKLEENNSRLKEEKKALQGRSSRLEKRNSTLNEERLLLDAQLSEFRTSGRYRLADAVAKNVLRIPGAKALARRARPEK
jgi:FtsZ-binding cell division protein ZapB